MSREVIKYVSMGVCRPAERIVVLYAYAWIEKEGGGVGYDSSHLPVLALVSRMHESGEVEVDPVIVYDGKTQMLSEMVLDLPIARSFATICCTWPKREDNEQLGDLLESMCNEVIEEAKQSPLYNGGVEKN